MTVEDHLAIQPPKAGEIASVNINVGYNKQHKHYVASINTMDIQGKVLMSEFRHKEDWKQALYDAVDEVIEHARTSREY